jgi:glycosyltransferase involved in cell wall biosynthesis
MIDSENHINPDDYLLLLLDGPPFEGMMQRHQQIMTRLARKVRVIYQEESASIISYLFKRRFPLSRAYAYKKGVRELSSNLWHIHSPPGLPERVGLRRVNHYNHLKAYENLAPHLRRFGGKLILWVAHPKAVELVDHIDKVLTIYDCYDAFGDFPEERWKAVETKRLERELLKKADLVLASAKSLVETRSIQNTNVQLVSNGADTDHFQKKITMPIKHYQLDITKIAPPIIGYMGDIASWLDMQTLEYCADVMKDINFVFLGTIKRDIDRLKSKNNVHFFGRIDYDDLPYFLGYFDVCTIPFLINEMTVHVNPIKVYEYMATGLPIVSSNLPEVNEMGELIYYYKDKSDFVEKVRIALNEPRGSSNIPQMRINKARENSWDARVEKIWSLIEGLLA